MKNRSLVLTVSLIAMMIVGVAHGAEIASTDYVTKSVGDEADLVWTAIDSINNEDTGILATAKSYTDDEITSAMEKVTDAIPTNNNQLTNGAGYITSASLPTKVSDLTNDAGFITAADIPDAPTVDDALSSTSTNAVQNKVVTAALSGKLDTTGSIAISQVNGLSDALAQAGSQLNEAQTAAVNSGITKAKVEAYDAYAGQIAAKADASAIPTNNNQLTNGAGYITSAALPTKVSDLTNDTGFITAADIPDAPTVDDALSLTSTNAVQNKIVTAALDGKLGKNEKAASAATADSATTAGSATKATQDASGNVITETYATKTELGGKMDNVTLATVATSGSYNDLSGLPTIPTNNNQLTNGAGYITSASLPGAASASAAGIMKWGQIPSGSATATTSATIWVQ